MAGQSLYRHANRGTLQGVLDRGGVIGGTSAGAAIMTRVMIEEGRREPKLCRGLDLFKEAVIDQHFFRRNRMQRLAKTLKRQPELIALESMKGRRWSSMSQVDAWGFWDSPTSWPVFPRRYRFVAIGSTQTRRRHRSRRAPRTAGTKRRDRVPARRHKRSG